MLEKITRFCHMRGIDRDLMEDLSAGLNHAEIGALIAEKWNFPDVLIHAIRYHHEPFRTPEESTDVVYTVYLANAFCDLEAGGMVFEQVDTAVLKHYHITSEEQFQQIHHYLKQTFKAEKEKS